MGQLPFKKDSTLCNTRESCDRFTSRYKEDVSAIRVRDGFGLWKEI